MKNLDALSKEYCNQFEWAVLNERRVSLFKNLVAGMRFGKTHFMVKHHIPFIFNNTNVSFILCTAPLSGTIEQTKVKMKSMCTSNGFAYTESPKEAQKMLHRNHKVVMYVTNAFAWVSKKMNIFLENQIKNKLLICTFMDEAWTWTIDSQNNVEIVSGNSGSAVTYKASWYTIMNELSSYSPYTYGMSATETFQLDGLVQPFWGSMEYENIIIVRDPKKLAHRLAWFGEVTYWVNSNTIFGDVSTKEQIFNKMISSIMKIENMTGKKRSALIECNPTYSEETLGKWKNTKNKDTTEDVKNMIINCNYKCDPNDFIAVVMTSDSINIFNKNGDIDQSSYDEDDIYEKLDDENDPLRFLIVMNMAKNGVTIRTLKEFLSFKISDKKSELGIIYYSKNQAQGRTLTPNCGFSNDEFYDNYGGSFLNVPPFIKELNTCNFYLHSNISNEESIKTLKKNFCPTYEDFLEMKSQVTKNTEICSMGFTLDQHDISDAKHKKLDEQVIDIAPKIEEKLEEKKNKIGPTALTDKQFQDINQIEPSPSIN